MVQDHEYTGLYCVMKHTTYTGMHADSCAVSFVQPGVEAWWQSSVHVCLSYSLLRIVLTCLFNGPRYTIWMRAWWVLFASWLGCSGWLGHKW